MASLLGATAPFGCVVSEFRIDNMKIRRVLLAQAVDLPSPPVRHHQAFV